MNKHEAVIESSEQTFITCETVLEVQNMPWGKDFIDKAPAQQIQCEPDTEMSQLATEQFQSFTSL